jgi:hypothetical protein
MIMMHVIASESMAYTATQAGMTSAHLIIPARAGQQSSTSGNNARTVVHAELEMMNLTVSL